MIQHVFTVYGSPVAQSRAARRHFIAGGRACSQAFDPAKSKNWKQDVKAQVLGALQQEPEIHDGPLWLKLYFHLPRPKSLPKRVTHHVKKPDADNLAKAIKDALRGIVYRDDSQIIALEVRKCYGDPPRVVIALEEVRDA